MVDGLLQVQDGAATFAFYAQLFAVIDAVWNFYFDVFAVKIYRVLAAFYRYV